MNIVRKQVLKPSDIQGNLKEDLTYNSYGSCYHKFKLLVFRKIHETTPLGSFKRKLSFKNELKMSNYIKDKDLALLKVS